MGRVVNRGGRGKRESIRLGSLFNFLPSLRKTHLKRGTGSTISTRSGTLRREEGH